MVRGLRIGFFMKGGIIVKSLIWKNDCWNSRLQSSIFLSACQITGQEIISLDKFSGPELHPIRIMAKPKTQNPAKISFTS